EVWEDRTLVAFLDAVSATVDADPKRIYLTGLSMGGFGAWSLGMRYAERFAALVPICGGGRVADVVAAARNRRKALETLGIWAFHGAGDIVVPLQESERMIDALHAEGISQAKLTVYPEVLHDAWTPSYANPELYRWLLKHQR